MLPDQVQRQERGWLQRPPLQEYPRRPQWKGHPSPPLWLAPEAHRTGISSPTAIDSTPAPVVFFSSTVPSAESEVPFSFTTVGFGYVPERSPPAVPVAPEPAPRSVK